MKTYSFPLMRSIPRRLLRENNIDSLTAEIWAREALMMMRSDLVLPNIAHVDYSDQVGTWGSVVHVNTLGDFTTNRKNVKCEPIVQQAITSTGFQLELNQYVYTSFTICDGEEDRPMRDLIETYMQPAMGEFIETLDAIVASNQMYFWANAAGHLNGMDTTNVDDYVLEGGEVMDLNKVPQRDRSLVITSKTKRNFLSNPLFVRADQSGSTRALRAGEIGDAFGNTVFTSYSQPYVNPARLNANVEGRINGAVGAGTTVLTVDGFTTDVAAGDWIVVQGDDVPHQVTAISLSSHAGTVTIAPGLLRAVADNAIITYATHGALVNGAGNYGPSTNPKKYGWAKRIQIDAVPTGTLPQRGQVVTFGTSATKYSIIRVYDHDVDGVALASGVYDLLLDRPLDAALADNVAVRFGPTGSFNALYSKNAIAIANRPLPKPRVGALASVVNDSGYAIRVVISYDASKQGHVVTLDTLFGTGLYDVRKGAVIFG